MYRFLIIVVCVSLFRLAAFGQIHDVNGWGKLKWGMTITQAKLALGKQASEPTAEQKQSSTWPVRLAVNDLHLDDGINAIALIETGQIRTSSLVYESTPLSLKTRLRSVNSHITG